MLLIPGFPAGEGFEFDLKYKFKTEDVATEAGYESRFDDYSKPQRELSFTLGSADSFAFSQLLTVLNAGAQMCIVPLWQFRMSMPHGVSAGIQNEVGRVYDQSEYSRNEFVYFARSSDVSLHEVKQITSIAGATIYLDSMFTRDYTPISMPQTFPYDICSGYMMPCISGIIDHEAADIMGGCPAFMAKLKIDGGAWEGAEIPSLASYLREPMEAKYNAPKILRDVQGTENGIQQLRPIEGTNRLTFELTWNFYNTDWRDLRDLFFAAKGKTRQFYMPTWMFELQITRGSDNGDISIFLPRGYQYVWERFPKLLVKPFRTNTTPFEVNVSDYVGGEEFRCDSLSHETLLNDRVCFYPLVRFETDELTFQFKDIDSCYVKAVFIEVLVEE